MSICSSLKTVRVEVNFGEEVGQITFDVYPRYKIVQNLGKGGYGYVVEAEDTEAKEEKDKVVAIKKLPSIFRHESLTKSALREITMLKHFSHDNILSIKDMIVPLTEKAEGFEVLHGDVYIVLDKMDLDLGQLLRTPTEIELDQRKFFVYQILRGLKCVHSAQVLHRDLKPQNLLINSTCDLKICDFGLARGYEPCGMTTNVATLWYRAPEILLEMKAGDNAGEICQYDNAVDIWSVGCIMAELMKRSPMFHGKANISSQLDAIFAVLGTPTNVSQLPAVVREYVQQIEGKYKNHVQDWAEIFPSDRFEAEEVDLVKKMLKLNGAERITVTAALEHPYLKDFHDPADEPCAKAKFVFPYSEADNATTALLTEAADFHPEIRDLVKTLPRRK
eukprot:RCo002880